MHDDTELLRRYGESHAGDAFAELVSRHLGLVYSTALRRVGGDAQLAEDVTQMVFIDLARKAHALRNRASLAGWLYAGAQLASAEVVRREQRRKTRETIACTMETSLSPQDPEADWSKLRPVLDDALNHLRDEDREAVLLRFFQQRSFAEIGGALRLSEEAARKRVDRALDRLRSTLAKHGVVSTAAALSTTLSAAIVESPVTLGAMVTQAALQSSGAAAATVTMAGAIKVLLPAAAAAALGFWLVTHQHAANGHLEAEVHRLAAVQQQIAGVRHENGELQRRLSMIEQLRSDAATLPTLQRSAAETNAATERRSVVVTITAEGTIRWGDRTLTLARFVHELKQLNASARDGATLVIRSDGASFDAFSYAVDEARLHGISHVVVERTGPVDSHSRFNWF